LYHHPLLKNQNQSAAEAARIALLANQADPDHQQELSGGDAVRTHTNRHLFAPGVSTRVVPTTRDVPWVHLMIHKNHHPLEEVAAVLPAWTEAEIPGETPAFLSQCLPKTWNLPSLPASRNAVNAGWHAGAASTMPLPIRKGLVRNARAAGAFETGRMLPKEDDAAVMELLVDIAATVAAVKATTSPAAT